jgi:ATP-dependent exoDNAse (exonuclease V) beta subunit
VRDEEAPYIYERLGVRFEHFLLDEFQDTSIQQFELISHLVEGFVPGDGKTLFVVGDPMQSIYRFRGAEVGLFLRAKHHGIGPVKLTSLQLTRNFRSTHALITWTNQQFCRIFPKHDDLELGAVAFHPAVPVRAAADIHSIQCQAYPTLEDQTHDLIRIIQHEISHHHDQKIAILVRSRNQLGPIVQQLREHNIPYQGIDIDWMLAHLA